MSDQKISQLPAASALDGTEIVPGVQGGASKKVTAAQLRDYTFGGGAGGGLDGQLKSRGVRLRSQFLATRGVTGKMAAVALNDGNLSISGTDFSSTGFSQLFRVACPTAAGFGRVRVAVPNIHTATVAGVKVGFRRIPIAGAWSFGEPGANGGQSTTNPNNDGYVVPTIGPLGSQSQGYSVAAWDAANTAFSVTLPAAINADMWHPSYTWTNWTDCASMARTDGGHYPLVDIALEYPSTAAAITLSSLAFGFWGIDGDPLGSATNKFNGGQLWKAFASNGRVITSGGNFLGQDGGQSNTPWAQGKFVPIIVQFETFGKVQSVVMINDSIGEYGDINGGVYSFYGAVQAAQQLGIDFSWCALPQPSGAYPNYGYNLDTLIDQIQPSIIDAKLVGPNEYNSGTTDADFPQLPYGHLAHFFGLCRKYGSRPIAETTMPSKNNGIMALGTRDHFRVDYNTSLIAICASRNAVLMDTATPLETRGTVTSGQREPAVADSADGIHLVEVGHETCTPAAKAAYLAAFGG